MSGYMSREHRRKIAEAHATRPIVLSVDRDPQETKDCECGCGEKILRWKRNGDRTLPTENRFAKNHDKRINRDPNEQWPCRCGCGTLINRWILKANGRPQIERKYILGHHLKGKKRPDFEKIVSDLTKDGDSRPHPKGPDHWNWQGGISLGRGNRDARKEYREWRAKVYARCSWTCVDCGYKGKRIIAHHIKSWADHPELRYDPDNGIVLCRPCHKLRHADIGLATRFKPQA